jgi:hypothetical protein
MGIHINTAMGKDMDFNDVLLIFIICSDILLYIRYTCRYEEVKKRVIDMEAEIKCIREEQRRILDV